MHPNYALMTLACVPLLILAVVGFMYAVKQFKPAEPKKKPMWPDADSESYTFKRNRWK